MDPDLAQEFSDIFSVEEGRNDFVVEFDKATRSMLLPKLSSYEVSLSSSKETVHVGRVEKANIRSTNEEKVKEEVQNEYLKMLSDRKKQNIDQEKKNYQKIESEKQSYFRDKKKHQKQFFFELNTKFKTAQRVMKGQISKRKQLFKNNYGELTTIKEIKRKTQKNLKAQKGAKKEGVGINSVFRYLNINNSKIMQPSVLKIKLNFLTGVKNKLPFGRYVLLFSLRSDLQSNDRDLMAGTGGSKASVVFVIKGKFDDTFIDFTMKKFSHGDKNKQKRISLIVPGYINRKPYLNLSISLVQIQGEYPGLCCGWGIFPVLNNKLEINSGRFVCPLLRGYKKETITKYSDVHSLLKGDLDNWLGNLYFAFELRKKMVDLEALKRDTDVGVLIDNDYWLDVQKEKEEEEDRINFVGENKIVDFGKSFVKKVMKSDNPIKKQKRTIVKLEKESELANMDEKEVRISLALEAENNHIKHMDILNESTYHVRSKTGGSSLSHQLGINFQKILQYIFISLFTDLKSHIFISIFFFCVTYVARLYVHYLFKYWYLYFIGVKSIVYYPSGLWVIMNFQIYDQFTIAKCLVLMGVGNFGNFLVLVLGIVGIVLFQWLPFFKLKFPLSFHIFVIFYFVNFFLDDFYNLIFDAIFSNMSSNNFIILFKLFESLPNYKNGIWGIFITVSFYLWIFLLGSILSYFYLLRVYRGGSIFDIYERLNETKWFLPMDHEVNLKELLWAVERAKKFRGKNGEKRRTKVWRVIEKDKKVELFENYYLLVRIYDVNKVYFDIQIQKQVGNDEEQDENDFEENEEIYRQFLVIPNQRNVIVEVFDQSELANYLKNYRE